jgi:hypothetical protein
MICSFFQNLKRSMRLIVKDAEYQGPNPLLSKEVSTLKLDPGKIKDFGCGGFYYQDFNIHMQVLFHQKFGSF